MIPQRWQQIDTILDAVLDAPPAERPALLQQLCAGDLSLQREVLALLTATEHDSGFLADPLTKVVRAFEAKVAAPTTEQTIGAYKIVREIGRGGMGVVYLAKRDDGAYQQQVAIKIVGAQLLSPHGTDLIQRFRQERQILASLNHPNIASLVDGGTTSTGLPYVVMEYIEGVPLQEYCDQQQLPLRARLRLFQKVCEAVQFAHQKLIIHRDLKPGNILVNQDGVVKLLDFGIAKLLSPEPAATGAEITQTLQLLTPAHASPEQLRGEPISTATDVYALGLILYELLTAQRAYKIQNLPLTEIIRIVCEELPPKPSTIVKITETGLPSTQRERLSAKLSGDLDTILLTALQKAPEQRYASVAAFHADIERYLAGLPIQARPATLRYRAQKFVQRNKKAVFAAVLLGISIVAGVASTLRQTRIAQDLAQARRRTIYTTQMNLAAQAWETSNLTRLRELLVGHFPAPGEEDLRGFEWYYFWRSLHHNGQLFSLPHPTGVIAAAYSPDGTMLATACEDRLLRLWDATNGQLLAELSGHTNFVNDVAFSQDGKRLVSSSSDLTAKIWDVTQRRELLTLKGHTAKVNRAVFSPDGLTVASCADDGTWKKWDASTGAGLFSVRGPGALIRAIAFSPDGKIVATGGNAITVKLWNAQTGKNIPFIGSQEKWQCWSIDFSSDGTRLAAGGLNPVVKIWQLTTNLEIAALTTSATQIHEVAFAPDGKTLATTSEKSIASIWDIESKKAVAQIKGHTNDIFSAAFAPDGQKLLTASLDNTARLWNLTEITAEFDQESPPPTFSALGFSPDHTQFVRGNDQNSMILLDLATGQIRQQFMGHQGYITKIIFSPDGRHLASGSTAGNIKVWDKESGNELFSCLGRPEEITALQYATNGKLLFSGGQNQTLHAWDATTGQAVFTSAPLPSFINKIAAAADDSLLATATYDAQVRLWNTRNWQVIQTLKGHTRPVSILAFSPRGNLLATGSEDDTIKLWSIPSGQEIATIRGLLGRIAALAFSPDGNRLAVATNDGFVSLWEPSTQLEIFSSKRHQSPVFHLVFTPDGSTLISGDRAGIVRYWRADSPQQVKLYPIR
ncbi:MAG: protein kinase [Acidobacteria bacterium]|nr:protein kinase [Acidobacteriota bacterium]